MGVRLINGRDFTERDTAKSAPVAIVNEAAVRRYFSGRNALGKRFGYGKPNFEIVGIVADARINNAREAAPPMAFIRWHSTRLMEVRSKCALQAIHLPASAKSVKR